MPNDNAPDRPRSAASPPDNLPPLSKQRAEQYACPYCTETMVSIGMHRSKQFQSQTLKCETCEECFLYVRRGNASTLIHLPDFLERRGDDLGKRPLYDRGMSEHLVHAMVCDIWPSPATTVDFGLDSTDHYAAMQRTVQEGITSYELDRVLGSGKAITQLVNFACSDRQSRLVSFSTAYDDLPMEPPTDDHPRHHRKQNTKYTLDS